MFISACASSCSHVLIHSSHALLEMNISYMFIADVIVHRLLAAALNLSKLPSVFHDKAQLNSISDSESDWGLLVHIIMLCNTGE